MQQKAAFCYKHAVEAKTSARCATKTGPRAQKHALVSSCPCFVWFWLWFQYIILSFFSSFFISVFELGFWVRSGSFWVKSGSFLSVRCQPWRNSLAGTLIANFSFVQSVSLLLIDSPRIFHDAKNESSLVIQLRSVSLSLISRRRT